jgi:GNAT superfamily N-acetyltransferase
LTSADLPFADHVRALAGWNQTLEDWRRFLALAPGGCFLAEWKGSPAGTATTIVYSAELAWIGMILVHPDYRRRGIGTALLEHCIAYLRGLGVRCLKLDATPAGKLVYDRLGFQDEWRLTRWKGLPARLREGQTAQRPRAWQAQDLDRVRGLDAAAFGASRRALLRALRAQSHHALVFEDPSGQASGYGLLRFGARALYLGPIAAASADAAGVLVEALLARSAGQTVYWDIPDPNVPAVAWARGAGFTAERSLTRMFLGDNVAPGNPFQQFALAGPEAG